MRFLFRAINWPDSTNRRIFRAAAIIGLLTLVAKSAAVVKELLVARWFGRSDTLDAFLIAYLVPSFVMTLTAGALITAFVPTFVETRQKQGIEAAQKLFSSALFLSAIALTVITILLALFAPLYLPYMGSSFSIPKLRLTRHLLYVVLPFVLFGGTSTFVSYVLNAGERFALAALTPLVTPVVTILFLELTARRWGAFSLASGILMGSFLEASLVVRGLKAQGLRFTFRWGGLDSSSRQVWRQYAPMLSGTFLMCFTSIVDQSMAAMLPGGSVAALSYAAKIIATVLALGSIPLSAAVLPYFSKMVAENDLVGCRHTLKRYSALVALTAVPFTACLMMFSRPLVRLLFQRGAFTSADTELVSWVQICYSIQIPFYICTMMFMQFLSSIKRNDILMYGAAINLVLDIVLNLVLMRVWGVAGIALSTSLVYVASFLFVSTFSLRLLARRRLSTAVVTETQEVIR
jgi:putative peptidoglycan lipid II flippase